MINVLITGGSGFIGTNLVQLCINKGWRVLSIDSMAPQNKEHDDAFLHVDILDAGLLKKTVQEFKPSHVVHLAARADLDGKDIGDYKANAVGVRNVIDALAKEASAKQAIFASTKLVCANGYRPKFDEDFCPDTLYGESKVEGERILRDDSSLQCPWCIVRPTSIWGPWFGVPYRGFFLAVDKGYYFHLGRCNPPRSFGYVGNIVFQLMKIMEATGESIHRRTFYLTDYEELTIREWADAISRRLKGRPARTVPEFMIQCAALAGDCLKKLGWKNPPMTSFRLNNMRIDTTGIPLESIKRITGPLLPYTMEQGVDETVAWMKQRNLIE